MFSIIQHYISFFRYESDKQINSSGYPFATGVTLSKLILTTTSSDQEEKGTLKIFDKKVTLDSFAIYWKPKATLYSQDLHHINENNIDHMFDQSIGTKEVPNTKFKYLVGPISSEVILKWCQSPEKFDYTKPQVRLFFRFLPKYLFTIQNKEKVL